MTVPARCAASGQRASSPKAEVGGTCSPYGIRVIFSRTAQDWVDRVLVSGDVFVPQHRYVARAGASDRGPGAREPPAGPVAGPLRPVLRAGGRLHGDPAVQGRPAGRP